MSRQHDLDPLPLDDQTAERILGRSVPPADTPPGYAEVARVLRAAAGPPAPAELAGEVEAVALLAAELRAGNTTPAPSRRSAVLSRVLTARFAAAALAGGLSLTTGLAAAGALPDPAQDVAATVLDKVGISVPDPDADVTTTVDTTTDADGDAVAGTTDATLTTDDTGSPTTTTTVGTVAPDVLSPTGVITDDDADDDADEPGDDPAHAAKPNHGTAVCAVASHDKCKQGDDPSPSGDPAKPESHSFEHQIEHCQDQGQTKQARFSEQGKTKQADKSADQAKDCQDKFESKSNQGTRAGDTTTSTKPKPTQASQGNNDGDHQQVSDDQEADHSGDATSGEVAPDDQNVKGDDHGAAHPPADPGSNGQGQKKGHDHAPGQSGRH